jgi:predicted negative regulator of RcsB-dependent stress response
MSILQDIDSTLHYENIENAWAKHKFTFALVLIAIFGSVVGYHTYQEKTVTAAKADSIVIFKTILENAEKADYSKALEASLKNLETQTGVETLKLELAKAYKKENNMEGFERTATELTDAKTEAVKEISTLMLAQHFLSTDAKLAVEFVDNSGIKANAFSFASLQEIKATALVKLGENAKAAEVFKAIIASKAAPSVKDRAEFKLKQINQ